VSLPQVLLVDDSEAVLAFERAALTGHCELTTATNGREALERMAQLVPDLLLLDLSMPEMDGGEVLARVKADLRLHEVPVVVLSSEGFREAECLKAGAELFLAKPVAAERLVSAVNQVLDEAQRRRRQGSLAALPVGVGPYELCLPLASVRTVLLQPMLTSLPSAPSYLAGYFSLHGQLVGVLDLAKRLGVDYQAPLAERKLVVVEEQGVPLALCLDRVSAPEEFPAEAVVPKEQVGGGDYGVYSRVLRCFVRASGASGDGGTGTGTGGGQSSGAAAGWLPVLEPGSLFSRALLGEVRALLRELPGGEP
jgi:CheY-like chemotaxis protein/chemotaxis signal transduction protein